MLTSQLLSSVTLNRNSAVPLHAQLSRFIREQIDDSIIEVGDSLPTEAELAAVTGVSRAVVRQAYASLAKSRYISSRRGKGTVVGDRNAKLTIVHRLRCPYHEAQQAGQDIQTNVLSLGEVSEYPSKVAELLEVSLGEKLVKLVRVRIIKGHTAYVWTSYLPSGLYRRVLREDFTKVKLYDVLTEKMKVPLAKSDRWVEIASADAGVANLLGVQEFQPIFRVENLTYAKNGEPVEYYEWFCSVDMRLHFEVL